MGKHKKPELPMYEQRKENEYNLANRNMVGGMGQYLQDNMYTQEVADRNINDAMNRFRGNANKALRNYQPTNRNRYGNLGSSLYLSNIGDNQKADLNRRMLSQEAQNYNTIANIQSQNDLQRLANIANQYNISGKDSTALDKINLDIRNQNKVREYLNELQRQANKSNPWNIAKNSVSGALKGFVVGGPLGAVSGAVGGAGQGVMNEYTDIGYSNGGKGIKVL